MTGARDYPYHSCSYTDLAKHCQPDLPQTAGTYVILLHSNQQSMWNRFALHKNLPMGTNDNRDAFTLPVWDDYCSAVYGSSPLVNANMIAPPGGLMRQSHEGLKGGSRCGILARAQHLRSCRPFPVRQQAKFMLLRRVGGCPESCRIPMGLSTILFGMSRFQD
jgi:hypothetical protein